MSRPLWPEGCKPSSLVERDRLLYLRISCAQGQRMAMPLGPVTFRMLWPKSG